jgi:putative DNA primase/helicase
MPSDDSAVPPHDNVVQLKDALAQAATQFGSPATASPPPPDAGAQAPSTGEGGGAGKKGGRSERRIDWGRYNWLLENFALIYSTDTVWDASSRLIMKISAMAHAHGADYVRMWKGSESSDRRAEGKRWTVMPTDVVFDPAGKHDPDTTVNLFGGIEIEPEEGDVKPMLELVRHLTSRAAETADDCDAVLHWLLCWMAYPLQHLGAKLRTAVIMHGDEGAGKNFLFDTLVMIYGEYGATVGQDELEDKFNDWRSRKLFVVGDEVSSRQELVHNKNRLKALITSPTVQINPKNLPRREEANHMNIAFLSNEIQPQALDNTDRRYLVIFTPQARPVEFYKALGEWRKKGGVAAWYHYLLHYPLDDWDPYAPAPVTEAKRDLIDLNRKTPERFWIEWSGGELELPYNSCSVDQAYRAYTKYCVRVGDRYPMQKQVYSRMLVRISESLGKPVRVKPMRVKVDKLGERTARMLLVCDPPGGTTEGQWATECVAAFESPLRRYLHGPHSPEGDDPPGDAA